LTTDNGTKVPEFWNCDIGSELQSLMVSYCRDSRDFSNWCRSRDSRRYHPRPRYNSNVVMATAYSAQVSGLF